MLIFNPSFLQEEIYIEEEINKQWICGGLL